MVFQLMYSHIRIINGIFLPVCVPVPRIDFLIQQHRNSAKKRRHASIVCLQLRRYLFLLSERKCRPPCN